MLAKIVSQVDKLPVKSDPLLGRESWATLSFHGESDGLSLPETAVAILDHHIVTPDEWDIATEPLADLIEKMKIDCVSVEKFERPTPDMLPYVVDGNNPYVRMFITSCARILWDKPAITYGESVGDYNYFGAYTDRPVIVFGPNGGNWHAPDEWVDLNSLRVVRMIYREYLMGILEYDEDGKGD